MDNSIFNNSIEDPSFRKNGFTLDFNGYYWNFTTIGEYYHTKVKFLDSDNNIIYSINNWKPYG